ncbi:MAG: 50S ribosomal protein L11 methyltransferase [Acidobacteria bacterium]|nr:50S ribosomal protein L11 methyltransferase [Acidobacteriota bacterium]
MKTAEPDWLLRISYPSGRRDLDDLAERILFLSCSAGSSIEEHESRTVVRLYFTSRNLRDEALTMVPAGLEGLETVAEQTEKIDWLDYYEHSLEPIEIGRRWLVVPDRRLLPDDTKRMPIVIPQEHAFGTGSHETTSLCLAMIESLDLTGKLVVDIGTGSGILAIGAYKMGAARIFAFDNDPETWGVVRANMGRNDVPEQAIRLFFGTVESIADGLRFDLITMNIIPEVILPSLPSVAAHLAHDGHVIFSGILTERAQMVTDRARQCGLILVDQTERGEWWCGRFGNGK